jgi:predicted dehydrogenase
MLEAEQPDGVILCIGPGPHAELAGQVVRRGIAVYTEKPPALSAAAALEVALLAHKTGVLCMTAFKKRYSTAYDRARRWVEQFDVSQLLSISINYASGGYSNGVDPRSDFLLDFGIHAIDLVGYLFGDVEEVLAFSRERHAYSIAMRFISGAVGSMSLNDGRSFSVPTEEVELTAAGGHWMSVRNSSCWRIAAAGQPSEWREPPTFTSAGDSGNETGHLAELVEFVNAIRGKRTVTRSHIYQSYKSMVLYEAIACSATSGKPVRVGYQSLK